MNFMDIDMPKTAFIYGSIFSLANRIQILGDRIDKSISTKQWFVLAAVSKFDEVPPNIGDIARLLGTSRQNIKKMANILEHKDYIKLRKDPNDLRNIQIFLTDKCNDYFESRKEQENEFMKSIFDNIDDETLDTLCKGLGKLAENIDQLIDSKGDE